jgi:hypothetical protein
MKFITKKHLHRRTFLQSASVTLGLPLLGAMVPAMSSFAAGNASTTAKRFVGIWHPHGTATGGWWLPEQTGKDFDLSYILKPMENLRDYITVISNLDCVEAFSTPEEPGGNHARGAVFLSGARPKQSTVAPYLGVTIDQLIAEKYGRDTILSSIQLGVEDAGNYGNCNWGYNCAYTNSMSWMTPTQPLPTEINPRVAFERLFGKGESAEERVRTRQLNASILDSVAEEIPSLMRVLGTDDKVTLQTYLDNVRELERRIQIAAENSVAEPSEEVPFGIPQDKEVHFKLMFDLIALAFEGDLTRSATMMLGRDLSQLAYPQSGGTGAWHSTSHHGDTPNNIANYAKMNRYHVSVVADFLETLRNIPEGDGNVLDHSLVYMGSNMGNSHRHAHEKVPVVLAGKIDGTFEGNRHIQFPEFEEIHPNLLLSILHLYGIEHQSIGESTHVLPIA